MDCFRNVRIEEWIKPLEERSVRKQDRTRA